MKKYLAAAMLVSLSLGFAGTAFAAESQDVNDIKFQQLKARVEALRSQVADAKKENKEIEEKKDKSNVMRKLKLSGDVRVKAINQHIGKHTTITESVQLLGHYSFDKDWMVGGKLGFMSDNNMGTTTRDTYNMPNFSAGDQRYDDYQASDNIWIMGLYLKKNNFLGNNSIQVGRMAPGILATQYWSGAGSSGFYDGVRLAFGNQENLELWYGNWGGVDTYDKYWNHMNNFSTTKTKALEKNFMILAKHKLSPVTTVYGFFLNELQDKEAGDANYKMRGIGFSTSYRDWRLAADFTKNIANGAVGRFFRLRYKGSDRAVPGTWTLGLDYMKIEPGNLYASALNGVNDISMGLKDSIGIDGFVLWGDYILRRNLRVAAYQSIGRKATNSYHADSYGTWYKGSSAPMYSRIHFIWSF
ncbi:MAG: hypothetical protein K6C05_10905 [Anaerovibrio sp.]|uniref:hypothetical protein n=1 Tax=Anaerovibrio sp. TaxID=1872532 RepID=UPI0025D29819|nr:hypothetical protein [Anaerovibrio sp.]MCR5177336.1 hypothetical protein [Anaerovibrio sp.]